MVGAATKHRTYAGDPSERNTLYNREQLSAVAMLCLFAGCSGTA
jgi:hypothetical protein